MNPKPLMNLVDDHTERGCAVRESLEAGGATLEVYGFQT
jgi:hypothetical protein